MNEEPQTPSEQLKIDPYISSEIAKGLERTQIGKYHTKGGHGFAAEDANAFADRSHFRDVDVTGTYYKANGADRIVHGAPIQTKYCQTAAATVQSAFDTATGIYRYQGQFLEVPSDQYDECSEIIREKISQGKIPGLTDPQEAEYMVRRGDVTYRQARNIARAGNIDSLLFDTKTQAVTTSYIFAISFAVHFAKRKWIGEPTDEALKGAIQSAVAAGGTALFTGIIAAQVLRTKLAAMGVVAARNGVRTVTSTSAGRRAIEALAQASLGKAVYGAAAINHAAKLLRSNVLTSAIAVAATSTPDFCRAAVNRSISWPQFTKNFAVNASGVAAGAGGWMGGAAAGAAIGSVVPGIGTAAGGLIGGIVVALTGGFFGSAATKKVMDRLIEDDAKRMVQLLQTAVEELADDYLLSEQEIAELGKKIKAVVDPKWLRTMYQAGSATNSDVARQRFAYNAFDEVCLKIVQKRPQIELPAPEMVQQEINRLTGAVLPRLSHSWKSIATLLVRFREALKHALDRLITRLARLSTTVQM